jgi:putative ABC transport system permease protein
MSESGAFGGLWGDLRLGARLLRHSPGFTLVAVVSLALGIGANTAIFQLLDAVRLRSLPVARPNELAEVRIVGGNGGMGINTGPYAQLTRPLWEEIERHQQAFSGAFAWAWSDVQVGEGSDLRRAKGLWVSGDFFRVLGVQAERGRLILPEDAGACPSPRVVVSHAYWQSHLGGRELGTDSRLVVSGERMDVVGVTPPEFFGLAVGERFDIAIPLCQPKEGLRRDIFDVSVMGRLRPDWTIEKASAHLGALGPGLLAETVVTGYTAEAAEKYKAFRLAVYPASSGVSALRRQYDTSLWLLLGVTSLVLLIACANLANLMLARASAREREVAVRSALGASRARLFRQLLAESALLAGLGAVAGALLAQVLSRVLVRSLSGDSGSISLVIATDWRVLLFTGGVGCLTCLVFGAMPALRGTRVAPVAAMRTGGRGMSAGRDRLSLQRLMVVTQIAVSLVLLVGAFLFVRSFQNLMSFDPGLRQEGIGVAFLGFQQSHVAPDRYVEFQRGLLDEVRSVPGVAEAATTTNVPLWGGAWGHGITVGATEGGSMFTWVSPGYFRTMGIPLLRGRDFEPADTQASTHVAVVNHAFVQKHLRGVDPLGRILRTHPEPNYPATEYEIVGVIPDTRYNDIRGDMPPQAFAPASQFPAPGPWLAVMIRSDVAPEAALAAVKRRMGEAHPEIVVESSVFVTRIRDGLVRERLLALLSGFFGLLAALLATVGLYGVVSYLVAGRRNEIGIRVALGAEGSQVVGMVMRDAGRMVAMGVIIGIALALAAGRSAGSLLFGLQAHDPRVLAGAALLLAAIAAGASFIPARRAARLDPMAALRSE